MSKLIGTKAFYKSVLTVAVPILIQNGITTFVSLLDNIMIGQVGTEQMSGVAIVNQVLFVYNLALFGILSGASIYGAQFYGKGDWEGLRSTFRFKVSAGLAVFGCGLAVFLLGGPQMIELFLHESDAGADLGAALSAGTGYLALMLVGLLPYAVSQIYASTLRETGETMVPMYAGVAAVIVNLLFNYILIFGKLGAPALGVQGAAIATVLSRYVECAIILLWTHRHPERNRFIVGAYRTLRVPRALVGQIVRKGTPLAVNEVLWSLGMTVLVQCYSLRGLDVVAAVNITNTINNLFTTVFMAIGTAVSILVGQLLGANRLEEARDTAYKTICFSVLCCVVTGLVMAGLSSLFPRIYNTTAEVRALAAQLILVMAVCMPHNAFLHATYFTIRSGGKTVITFLFDSGFTWAVSIPLAYLLTWGTGLSTLWIFAAVNAADLIKCVIGYFLLRSGFWMNNMAGDPKLAR